MAVRILASTGEIDSEEAGQIVDDLVWRYLRRKQIEESAPGFAEIRGNLARIQAQIQGLVNQIRILDEVTISAIEGSKLMILLENPDLDPSYVRKLFVEAQPEKLCNDINNKKTKTESEWINRLVSLDKIIGYARKSISSDKSFSGKGPRNSPYINKVGSPELKLIHKGWEEFEIYNHNPSATRGSNFYLFINHIRRYSDGHMERDCEWVHQYVLKYIKICKTVKDHELRACEIREMLEVEKNDELMMELCEIESDLDYLNDFFDDDLLLD